MKLSHNSDSLLQNRQAASYRKRVPKIVLGVLGLLTDTYSAQLIPYRTAQQRSRVFMKTDPPLRNCLVGMRERTFLERLFCMQKLRVDFRSCYVFATQHCTLPWNCRFEDFDWLILKPEMIF